MPLDHAKDRDRKNRQNAAKREIGEDVPRCKNPERRRLAEADVYLWIETYFSHVFTDPFTEQRKAIVSTIFECALTKRTQAIAAPRGIGKTSLACVVLLFMIVTGQIRFAVVYAANASRVEELMENLRALLISEESEIFAEDYPELVYPMRDVEGASQKCRLQTVDGKLTKMQWKPKAIKFPSVRGNVCGGSVLLAISLESATRGVMKEGKRPDFVLIDDPETDAGAQSQPIIDKLRKKIINGIGGMARQGKRLGMLMLTTIQSIVSLSYEFTDIAKRPAWNGKRWRAVEAWPTNKALWEEYVFLRKEDQQNGDQSGRQANALYESRREEMDAGAVVSNPYAIYDGCISAIQSIYNEVADKGMEFVLTEYQNDPPKDDATETSGLTDLRIISKQWTGEQYIMPDATQIVTATIDLGKYACHWEVNAWLANDAGFTIDYGVLEVKGTEVNGDKTQTETAIYRALSEFYDLMRTERYFTDRGEWRQVNLVMVDSGEFTDAVYRFCATTSGLFVASKGYGDTYSHRPTPDKILGNHYYLAPVVYDNHKRINLVHLDSNHWKQVAHDAWLTPTLNEDASFRAGSMCLYHTPEKSRHHTIAKHKTAEEYRETFIPGKGMKRAWFKVRANNHWGDTGYMGFAAREIVKAKQTAARRRAAIPANVNSDAMFPSLQGVSFNPGGY